MRDNTMIPHWRSLYCVLLVALIGAPGLEAWIQISWIGEVTAGFSTIFTCSSFCHPNCTYTWTVKGRTVNGSSLTWAPDGLENTVVLQCNALNLKTGDTNSISSVVKIKNEVSVQPSPQNTVPSLNRPLDLVCHGAPSVDPSHPVKQVVWYKDGQKVTLRENMQLLQNNLTLHFDSPLRSDAGFYLCETYVPTLQQTRIFSLVYLLSFDPWVVSITGPDTVSTNRLNEFTCWTSCNLNVDCTVRWEFRQGFPIGTYFAVHQNKLLWTPSIPGTLQNFTCIAENTAAGRSAEATVMVEVKGDNSYCVPVSGSEAVQLSGLFTMMVSLGLLVLFDS